MPLKWQDLHFVRSHRYFGLISREGEEEKREEKGASERGEGTSVGMAR